MTSETTSSKAQEEPWQKVGVEDGVRGNPSMAQVYVPGQGFGQNLYGPEWLIDQIITDHNRVAALEKQRDENWADYRRIWFEKDAAVAAAEAERDEAQLENFKLATSIGEIETARLAAEASNAELRRQLAGWLVAACANCALSIAQFEPGQWVHFYGPMIGRALCNTKHGAESDHATPDKHYYERVAAALTAPTPDAKGETA